MRWHALFDDLEAQLVAERAAELDSRDVDHERHRVAQLPLRERIATFVERGAALRLRLTDGTELSVSSVEVGADWIAGIEVRVDGTSVGGVTSASGCLVPLDAIASVLLPSASDRSPDSGRPPHTDRQPHSARPPDSDRSHRPDSLQPAAEPRPAPRMPLTIVLRDLARQRTPVTVVATSARLHGTIDRVGVDHLDLAVHEPGAARRAAAVRGIELVPLGQVLLVRFRW